MPLTETEKKRIQEEEEYRAKIKDDLSQSPNNNPKNKKGIGCLGVIGILFVLGVLVSAIIAAIDPPEQLDKARQSQSQNVNNQYVFDIPSLVGKDLDGVISMLGTPRGQDPTALQIQQGITEWDKLFTKDGKELLVTYNIANRKIVDFFISTDDPSGLTTNMEHLLNIGNLSQNDPRYTVDLVKAIKNPTSFTGVRIIPK